MRAKAKLSNRQDNPIYAYHSERSKITLQLTDDYTARKQMLAQLQRDTNRWFELALGRAPLELHSTLQVRANVRKCLPFYADCLPQKHLAQTQITTALDASDLGSSVALEFGKGVGPIDRKLCESSVNP